jgi:hypothetical protein
MSDAEEDEEFVSRLGPIAIDWPRTVGYYGAIGAAVAFDVIAPAARRIHRRRTPLEVSQA